MRRLLTYRLKAFTIVELMVTLALTSAALTFAYTTLNYVQKLFQEYRRQNGFIQEFTRIKHYLDHEALNADLVLKKDERILEIHRDSVRTTLELRNDVILMTTAAICDTFHFPVKELVTETEAMKNPEWNGKLIRSLKVETEFGKQKFTLHFNKHYEASVKMELEGMDQWQE